MSAGVSRAEIQAVSKIDGAHVYFSFCTPLFRLPSFLSSLLPSFPPPFPTRVQGEVSGEVVDVNGVGLIPVGEFGPDQLQRLHLQGGGEGGYERSCRERCLDKASNVG